jgi:hypothetical protein
LCQVLGLEFDQMAISGTHLDNELHRLVGLNYTQLEALIMIDVVARVKTSMINKALDGDVSAGKYVLNNVSDWNDKQSIDLSSKGEAITVKLAYEKKQSGDE